ncbi:hypothetical protein HMPREF3155_01665 [Corynebacterium sp. HMSC06D04]|uniref:Uncharacterized protein n=2 Tax=Corynebacterium TaxID=1716 RepID=A0A2A4ALN9_9CORY|nr:MULTISPECIES: hypothetical protein [Corynebacterium]PCC83381.1 hypothetical protein COM45_03215 [Corynebacterium accolens]KXU18681.1 putative ornithine cyclodeaminase [Corynebacterium simulans]OFM02826.1 hypothetical protein HMPREF2724_04800 [Corynebacterium sp. HMSC071F07]OFT36326.1 hypothetical protein HMPREF3169_01575 [Corynebacterium sp. HMSC08C04]OFT53081.1 hypothetical protein HMPREF3155_01665 [Corynebacterium sp. HMSC06D04]
MQLLDGQAVTNLRTPAVSVATIVDFLEGPGNASSTANEPLRVVIFVALGSHTPDARELSGELVGASTVIVEDLDATFVEGGDVIQAEAEGFIERKDVVSMAEIIRGDVTGLLAGPRHER